LFYDEQNRLSNSIWYIGAPYRAWFLTYPVEPYAYPNPLDFNNYRFYTLTWGGFENSCPIYDKFFAPSSISFCSWDSYNEEWYPINSSTYGVQVFPEEIALINNQPGNYSGFFYYNQEGTYTHKAVYYSDGGSVNYTLDWEYGTPADDLNDVPDPCLVTVNPNPFSDNLIISIKDNKTPSDISIYNLKGQLIRFWNNVRTDELTWDSKDANDQTASSGVYFIKTKQDNKTSTLKVIKL
jgi:hypothetical protein